jgi:general secretion pathway protein K
MRARQRGIALVSVLWVVVLLAVVAAGLSASTRNDVRLASDAVSAAQARGAAEGAMQRVLYELLAAGEKVDRSVHEFTLGDAEVRVDLADEAGRIDLNAASAALLEGLLSAAPLPPAERRAIVDAILDWRDPDHAARPYGAEDDDYRAQGRPYGARDAPFQSVDELQLVLGMSPAIYAKLKPSLTVHSRQAGINPAAASREVLLAVPGVDPAQVEQYVSGAAPALPPQFVARIKNAVFGLHAQARMPNGATAHVTAKVILRPFALLDWRAEAP